MQKAFENAGVWARVKSKRKIICRFVGWRERNAGTRALERLYFRFYVILLSVSWISVLLNTGNLKIPQRWRYLAFFGRIVTRNSSQTRWSFARWFAFCISAANCAIYCSDAKVRRRGWMIVAIWRNGSEFTEEIHPRFCVVFVHFTGFCAVGSPGNRGFLRIFFWKLDGCINTNVFTCNKVSLKMCVKIFSLVGKYI